MFGWERSRLSRVTNTLTAYLFDRWKHLLRWDAERLTPTQLSQYAQAVQRAGSPLSNCCGFLDGTMREVARPVQNQRILFNGWKRHHALKFHSLITPDGMHIHVYGPVEGRRHDETIFQSSGLQNLLSKYLWSPNGKPLVIYADSAYGLSQHLLSPFQSSVGQAGLSQEEKKWNYQMSRVRESVEWSFGNLVRTWPAIDGKHNKVLLTPIGIQYLVAVLLTNARNIMQPGQVSQFFSCAPPSLSEYFHGLPSEEDEEAWDMRALAGPLYEECD